MWLPKLDWCLVGNLECFHCLHRDGVFFVLKPIRIRDLVALHQKIEQLIWLAEGAICH